MSTQPETVHLEFLACRLFLERPDDIDTYEHALKHLDNNALNETESLNLICHAADTQHITDTHG